MNGHTLPIAHRVWTEPQARPTRKKRTRPNKRAAKRGEKLPEPSTVLFFDTETTTDRRQSLTFGSWRYCRIDGEGLHCIDEGIFHADDLEYSDPEGLEILTHYVHAHEAATERTRQIRLMTRAQFVNKVLFLAAYRGRARVVGFNLPFDLSRLAIGVTEARGANFGGMSLILAEPKPDSEHIERRHRARVVVKHLDSTSSFISFRKPMEPDRDDLIPEGSAKPRPDKYYAWRGRFVDLKTLAFALSGKAHTLDGACQAFDVEGKSDSGGYGVITAQHVSYCRQDVAATVALYEALITELQRHPVALAPESTYSGASLSKAYLSAMGIKPLLARHPDFPPEILGYAMSAFFGGRAECRIRRVPVPVALLDVTSMYPTVDTLMDLHRLQLARRIEVDDATEQVVELLESVGLEECFDHALWPQLVGFALVQPDGDILPVRAAYDGKTWGIGVNPLTSDEPLWYSLADCVACKILTGKAPKVLQALRLRPVGGPTRLRPIKLRGAVEIDPMLKDPMATIVEERQRVKRNVNLAKVEKDRLSDSMKLVANAGAYGIYSEFNPRERQRGITTPVKVYGRKDSFIDRVAAPEDPGRYCFPPFATCITGAARLTVAMLERCVTELGGTWAFCDTDSMAIVSTEKGGLVTCPGGPTKDRDVTSSIRALSHKEIGAIRQRFSTLNPFDHGAVPDLLKLEALAHCYAISAKRYALYNLDSQGNPIFIRDKLSRHGLGHFLNPDDKSAGSQEWIETFWRMIIQRAHGKRVDEPEWLNRPTMVKTAVTSIPVLWAFRHLNAGHPYAEQVKPFNFVLTAAGAKRPAGIPISTPFRLIAPYETDPRRWESAEWTDVHHPEAGSYRITTRDGRPGMARVDTFADVLAKYETHPESKSLGPDGEPCGRATVGLLQRRPVVVGAITLIGKESNRLEERSHGELTVNDLDQRLTTYTDHDEWYRIVLPRLREIGVKRAAEAVGMSERRMRDVLKGRAFPHQGHRDALIHLAEGTTDSAG